MVKGAVHDPLKAKLPYVPLAPDQGKLVEVCQY